MSTQELARHQAAQNNHAQRQAEMIATMRRESCLDRAVPLGSMPAPRPETGPDAANYFRAKHTRGKYGRFFPLHELAVWTAQKHRERRE